MTLLSHGHTRLLHLIHKPEDRPNLELTKHSSNNYHTSSVAISAQGLRAEVRGIFFPALATPWVLGPDMHPTVSSPPKVRLVIHGAWIDLPL